MDKHTGTAVPEPSPFDANRRLLAALHKEAGERGRRVATGRESREAAAILLYTFGRGLTASAGIGIVTQLRRELGILVRELDPNFRSHEAVVRARESAAVTGPGALAGPDTGSSVPGLELFIGDERIERRAQPMK
ncbi:MAG: hypothetical protein ABI702_15940 [Burkholderiales bacterium]